MDVGRAEPTDDFGRMVRVLGVELGIAINYVKRKLPVAAGAWDTPKYGKHVHAFTVTHSTTAHIVDDIFGIMVQAMEKGTGLGAFKRDMHALMRQKQWYGRPEANAGGTPRQRNRMNPWWVNPGTAAQAAQPPAS